MDEPFGALDEITRNRLDSDLLDLWRAKKLTVIFVTHSIYEAVYLSTRVVVMAARPGRLIEEVRIDEPYPRGPEFRVSHAPSATMPSSCRTACCAPAAGSRARWHERMAETKPAAVASPTPAATPLLSRPSSSACSTRRWWRCC